MMKSSSSPLQNNDGVAMTKLFALRRKSFRDQAIWFLNTSSAGDHPEKCECVRRIVQKCSDIDSKGNDDESVLDEFTAHRLLEFSNATCTTTELRKFVEGIHGNKRMRFSLAELLIYAFNDDWRKLVSSPDCNELIAEKIAMEEFEKRRAELERLNKAAIVGATAAENARQAEKTALVKENEAEQAANAATISEQSSRQLMEKEMNCLDALKIQEETIKQRRVSLENIVADSSKGIVTRNKANAELAILLSEDPLQLRAARIKQETSLRKSTEALSKSTEAVVRCKALLICAQVARAKAIELREIAVVAAEEAENKIPNAQLLFEKITHTTEDITKKQGSGRGTIFFSNAELSEQRKFLPKSKYVISQKNEDGARRWSMSST